MIYTEDPSSLVSWNSDAAGTLLPVQLDNFIICSCIWLTFKFSCILKNTFYNKIKQLILFHSSSPAFHQFFHSSFEKALVSEKVNIQFSRTASSLRKIPPCLLEKEWKRKNFLAELLNGLRHVCSTWKNIVMLHNYFMSSSRSFFWVAIQSWHSCRQ